MISGPVHRPDAASTLLLPRRRLVERLHAALRGPVTLLRAPAGFGKSVLVSQWQATHPHVPVVAVRLQADDDRASFGRRLVKAVAASSVPLDPRTLAQLHHGVAVGDHDVVPRVLEAMSRRRPAVLVLDAFDAPRRDDLAADLRWVAGRRQLGLHLAIVARSEHGPQMARLLAGHDLSRLGAADLAFTRHDTRRLGLTAAGHEISVGELDALHLRTEGWPVAVHLAMMALRQRGERPGADVLLDSVSVDNPAIAAVMAEVLDGLPIRLQRFARRASVLDSLTGPACDAVAARGSAPNGALALRLLARRGVPLRVLPGAAGGFAFHPLVREHLQRELRRDEPGANERILRRAAAWHEARGEPELAAGYLLSAHDWDGAIALVDRRGRALADQGRADHVLAWLDAIPQGVRARRHELLLRRTVLHTRLGHTRRAELELRSAGDGALCDGERVVAEALRASWVFVDAGPRSALGAADAALHGLDQLGDRDLPDILGLTSRSDLRAMATCARGRALWCAGDVDAARACFQPLLDQPEMDPVWRSHLLGSLALLEAWAGNLRLAHRYANESLRVATAASLRHHPSVRHAFLAEAHVRLERAELEPARFMLDVGAEIGARSPRPTTAAIHAVEEARWCLAARRPEHGLQAIDRRRLSGDPVPPPLVRARLLALEVQLHLAAGRVDVARSLLARGAEETTSDLRVAGIDLALAEGSPERARGQLARWDPAGGQPAERRQHELYTAIVDFESGERRPAKRRARQLFEGMRAEGFVRLVLDAGEPARRLLEALATTAATPYERHLIRASASLPRDVSGDLTPRELEVARYLPTPLSNAEIASQLFISVNTLKTHLRAIYRKLDVPGRREANQRLGQLLVP